MSADPPQTIASFLGQHAPFETLSFDVREALASRVQVEEYGKGGVVIAMGQECEKVLLVRSGGVKEEDAEGGLVAHHGEGEVLGAQSLLTGGGSRGTFTALADTVVYAIGEQPFRELCEDNAAVSQYFEGAAAERLRGLSVQPPKPSPGGASLGRRVGSLLTRPLVAMPGDTPIGDAARRMTEERVSSVVVTGDAHVGIVTDRDLRSRVLAAGRDPKEPLRSIMSAPLAGVETGSSLLEALMEMMRRKVHHLAVFEAGMPVGVVSLTDLVQSHVANPVFVLDEIARQEDVEGLVRASGRRPDVLLQMVSADVRAPDTHRILTEIGDAITRRLIELAWREVAGGEDPKESYCWVAFGSQARQEHALGSDQDNGLILSDELAQSDEAVKRVAELVCDGLDACGYPRCKGEIMAVVDQWRQPVSAWKKQFSRWIKEPTKDAVMRCSIFFDMRAIHGDASLVEALEQHVLGEVQSKSLFMAHLASDAMNSTPPLGFFGQLVVEHSGDHGSRLDLKHKGLIPIVDLARVYGLESGCSSPMTLQRLKWAAEKGGLSPSGCEELSDAFECIGRVRLRLHARSLKSGDGATNYLDPKQLSSAERGLLRDAFSVVRTLQRAMQSSRQLGIF